LATHLYNFSSLLLESSEALSDLVPSKDRSSQALELVFGNLSELDTSRLEAFNPLASKLSPEGITCLEIERNQDIEAGGCYLFSFPGLARFIFLEDQMKLEIWSTCDFKTTSHLLLDHVCPYILSLKNSLVLHASCLTRKGKTLIFCGRSGSGKSTIAGNLIAKDWLLVSDDLACFSPEDGLLPTYGALRLWQDSADSSSKSIAEQRTQLSQRSDKQKISLKKKHFSRDEAPFPSTVFLLNADSERSGINIELANGQRELVEILASSFLLNPEDSARQFKAIQKLKSRAEIFRISYRQTKTSAEELVSKALELL